MSDRPKLTGQSVDTTDTPCPRCKAEGHTTLGGYTPFLRKLTEPTGVDDARTFCLTHGYIDTEGDN